MIVVFFQQRTYSGFKELLNHDFLLSSHLSSQKYKNYVVGKLLFSGAWSVTTQTSAEKRTPRKQTKTPKALLSAATEDFSLLGERTERRRKLRN